MSDFPVARDVFEKAMCEFAESASPVLRQIIEVMGDFSAAVASAATIIRSSPEYERILFELVDRFDPGWERRHRMYLRRCERARRRRRK